MNQGWSWESPRRSLVFHETDTFDPALQPEFPRNRLVCLVSSNDLEELHQLYARLPTMYDRRKLIFVPGFVGNE